MERIGISVNGSSLVSFIQHLLQHLTQICAHLSAPGEPSAGHQGTAGSGGLTPPQLSGQTHFGENLQFEKLTTCCILVAQDNWDCFTCLNVLPISRERWKTQTIPKPQKKKKSETVVKRICIWKILPGYTSRCNTWDISA